MDYPERAAARDRWIIAHRGPKNHLNERRPYAWLHEEEYGPDGRTWSTATIFLTNRECSFRCLMCDLWRNTLDGRVPVGAIPEQITWALAQLPTFSSPCQIKLYNAGSFFDVQAIPPEDYAAIAACVAAFDRVIVECHPALLLSRGGPLCLAFQRALRGQLEVAIGLETAHPDVLARLNKRMTIETFCQAARFLRTHAIELRTFILLQPPFLDEAAGAEWACRSLDLAMSCEAAVMTVIPTRGGSGPLEALGTAFSPPPLAALETVVEYGVSRRRGRVFADLWEVAHLTGCTCAPRRLQRLAEMNHTQQIPPCVHCEKCGGRVDEEECV